MSSLIAAVEVKDCFLPEDLGARSRVSLSRPKSPKVRQRPRMSDQ